MKILYVAGTSYSGSTVLAAILGMHPQVVSGGEVTNFVRRSIERPAIKVCACASTLGDCPFWSAVKENWLSRTGQKDLLRFYTLLRERERIRYVGVMPGQNKIHADFQEYQALSLALLESMCDVSGRAVVVDSSKTPARQMALSLLPDADFRPIHIIRHGPAVVSSTLKHHDTSSVRGAGRHLSKVGVLRAVLSSSMDWAGTNLMIERAAAVSRKPLFRLRYEDLAQYPAVYLRSLGNFAGMDFNELADAIQAGEPISFGHTLGNPANRQGVRPLKLDDSWRARLPFYANTLFSLLAGMAARRYSVEQKKI